MNAKVRDFQKPSNTLVKIPEECKRPSGLLVDFRREARDHDGCTVQVAHPVNLKKERRNEWKTTNGNSM